MNINNNKIIKGANAFNAGKGFAGWAGEKALNTGLMLKKYPNIERMRELAGIADRIRSSKDAGVYVTLDIRDRLKEILFALPSVGIEKEMRKKQKIEWLSAAVLAKNSVISLCERAEGAGYLDEIGFLLEMNKGNFSKAKKDIELIEACKKSIQEEGAGGVNASILRARMQDIYEAAVNELNFEKNPAN